jgi:hypothetical protein
MIGNVVVIVVIVGDGGGVLLIGRRHYYYIHTVPGTGTGTPRSYDNNFVR